MDIPDAVVVCDWWYSGLVAVSASVYRSLVLVSQERPSLFGRIERRVT